MSDQPSSQESPLRFSPDQVNAILRRAIERQGAGATSSISYTDLLDTARELGIDPSQLDAAIGEYERHSDVEDARNRYIAQRKQKFREHLRSYVVVNLFLFILDMVFSNGTWFYWVLFGWGIGLYFDAAETFFPKEKDIERGALKILEREDRKRRKLELENARNRGKGVRKSLTLDSKAGKIIIEHGDKRIEIG